MVVVVNYLAMSKSRSTTGIKDYSVQRTVSLPFSLIEDVNDEAELSGKTFSGALQMLIRLGVRQREQFRINEERMQKETLEQMVEASKKA
jgi:hypothetical protein